MVKRLPERPRGEQPLSLRLSSENPESFLSDMKIIQDRNPLSCNLWYNAIMVITFCHFYCE